MSFPPLTKLEETQTIRAFHLNICQDAKNLQWVTHYKKVQIMTELLLVIPKQTIFLPLTKEEVMKT